MNPFEAFFAGMIFVALIIIGVDLSLKYMRRTALKSMNDTHAEMMKALSDLVDVLRIEARQYTDRQYAKLSTYVDDTIRLEMDAHYESFHVHNKTIAARPEEH